MSSREVVETLYDVFARGDMPAVLGLLASEVEWTQAAGYPYAGTYTGPEAVLNGVFARVGSEWDGYKAQPSSYVVDGDTVVTLGTYSGTYKATGRSFKARYAHVFTVHDDKITHFEQIVDSAMVMRALDNLTGPSRHRPGPKTQSKGVAPASREMQNSQRAATDSRGG
jgi:ketosteroid isomerase-like protein